VPGGGAAFVHLSSYVPAIKQTIEDPDERIGADIVQKVRALSKMLDLLKAKIMFYASPKQTKFSSCRVFKDLSSHISDMQDIFCEVYLR
jgi:hypothetical protein